eukprot:scaffold5224_cov129-Skeletonema_marinoi.AAC.3
MIVLLRLLVLGRAVGLPDLPAISMEEKLAGHLASLRCSYTELLLLGLNKKSLSKRPYAQASLPSCCPSVSVDISLSLLLLKNYFLFSNSWEVKTASCSQELTTDSSQELAGENCFLFSNTLDQARELQKKGSYDTE